MNSESTSGPNESKGKDENVAMLGSLLIHLSRFAKPSTPNGFFKLFSAWVVEKWGSRPYYRLERFPNDFELAKFPVQTDFLLKEMQPCYRDFIHSYNGRHHFNPVSVGATSCETLEKELYDFFHESMRSEGVKFLEQQFPGVDAEDFWDRIFMEEFREAEEIRIMVTLCQNFGFFGLALDPYLCPPHDIETNSPGSFADWELEDFRQWSGKAFILSHAIGPFHQPDHHPFKGLPSSIAFNEDPRAD
jgi:hypothetical protein